MLAANNITLLEPNVLYLDEKPPKIVKSKKPTAATKSKKPTKKKEIKKTITKTAKIQQKYLVKQEVSATGKKDEAVDPNDPLYMPQVEIKTEEYVDELEPGIKLDEDIIKQNYEPDEQGEDLDDDEDYDFEDDDLFESELQKMELSDDDDEDEPLIKLTRRKGRPRKYNKKDECENTIKAPRPMKCRLSCKQNCNEKFTEEQRKRMCAYYWHLSDEEKMAYLRKHVKSKRLTRFKRVRANPRGNNCCYYLKDCINDNDDYVNDDATHTITDLVRVCRKYFEATLCVTNHFIKKALTGYALEAEKDLELLVETIKANKEKEKEQAQQIIQVLDPETGNLITIEPKDKMKKSKTLSSESKPKEKRIRRKPTDAVEEHFPTTIRCAVRCIHKCHTKFTEQERKQMCDIFWSMDFKHRKDYILANVEVKEIETQTTAEFRTSNRPPRAYHTRFFLRTGLKGEKKRVCKHFLINTLRTNRTFISNAIEFADKTTGYYTGADRRGQHAAANKISGQRSQAILDHINSYPTWVPNKKSKTKYLHHSLTIKKMFKEYLEKCQHDNIKSVSARYYYKSFHDNFRLFFLANPDPKKGGGFLKLNPNISHYTGEEPGGYWLDPKGERLDIRLFNPAQSVNTLQQPSHYQQQEHSSIVSKSSQDSYSNVDNPSTSFQLNPLNYARTTHQLANFVNPPLTVTSSLNPRAIDATSLLRLDLNPNLCDNLPQSSSSMFRMI